MLKISTQVVKFWLYECGFVVAGVSRQTVVALTTLAHLPVVRRATDE